MADYQLTQTGSQVQTALDKVGTTALSTTATDLSDAVNELVTDIGGNTTKIGDLNNLVTTAKSDTVSAINEVASDIRGSSLFQIISYSYAYTIDGGSSLNISATDMDVSTPTGYKPIALAKFSLGNGNACAVFADIEATGSSACLTLRNISSSSISGTAWIGILYVKAW